MGVFCYHSLTNPLPRTHDDDSRLPTRIPSQLTMCIQQVIHIQSGYRCAATSSCAGVTIRHAEEAGVRGEGPRRRLFE